MKPAVKHVYTFTSNTERVDGLCEVCWKPALHTSLLGRLVDIEGYEGVQVFGAKAGCKDCGTWTYTYESWVPKSWRQG